MSTGGGLSGFLPCLVGLSNITYQVHIYLIGRPHSVANGPRAGLVKPETNDFLGSMNPAPEQGSDLKPRLGRRSCVIAAGSAQQQQTRRRHFVCATCPFDPELVSMSYQQNLPGCGPVDPPSDAYWYNSDRGTVPDTQLPDMQGIAGTEQYYCSLALQQTADARYMPPLQPGFAPWQPTPGVAQSSQSSALAGSSGKTERAKNRRYTPDEEAVLAAVYCEHKYSLEDDAKNGKDVKAAWHSFQQKVYTLKPALAQDFPKLQQLKDKVKTLKSKYTETVAALNKDKGGSGNGRPNWADSAAFKAFEASMMAVDPMVRHEGLLDRRRPEGATLCSPLKGSTSLL